MNEIIDLIIKWAIPFILSGICGYAISSLGKKKELKAISEKKDKIIESSLVLILRSQITGKVETAQERGYLPEYIRACITDLYTQYKALGGNHGVDTLVDDCFRLPSNQNYSRRKEDKK